MSIKNSSSSTLKLSLIDFFSLLPEISSQFIHNQKGYIAIMRIDHWFKNVFMLPGMVLALVYFNVNLTANLVLNIFLGIFATCLIASANYVINEWLDAEFDKFHPVKKFRPSVTQALSAKVIYSQYIILSIAGLTIASSINLSFFFCALFLLIMGFLYNVEPFRTKDKQYLDVISESINNPIRLALGWFIFVPAVLPPSSMLLAYWMGGAFLMATKRFAEYRFINDAETAGLYRRSFKHYTEQSLLISIFFYALTATFFLGIFLIKHRIEFLFSFPLFALLFAWYLQIGFRKDSPVQYPEKLYKEKIFMLFIGFLTVILLSLFYIDMPWLQFLLENNLTLS